MSRESSPHSPSSRPPANQRGTHGADLVLAALDFLRGGIPADVRPCGSPTLARQKKDLRQWTDRLGLLLSSSDLPAKVVRGGQEHELFHDEVTDRYFKVTRNGVFGLSPGIELALVSSAQDARRFHLWEASPIEYHPSHRMSSPHYAEYIISGIEFLRSALDEEFLLNVDLQHKNLNDTVVLGEVLGNREAEKPSMEAF